MNRGRNNPYSFRYKSNVRTPRASSSRGCIPSRQVAFLLSTLVVFLVSYFNSTSNYVFNYNYSNYIYLLEETPGGKSSEGGTMVDTARRGMEQLQLQLQQEEGERKPPEGPHSDEEEVEEDDQPQEEPPSHDELPSEEEDNTNNDDNDDHADGQVSQVQDPSGEDPNENRPPSEDQNDDDPNNNENDDGDNQEEKEEEEEEENDDVTRSQQLEDEEDEENDDVTRSQEEEANQGDEQQEEEEQNDDVTRSQEQQEQEEQNDDVTRSQDEADQNIDREDPPDTDTDHLIPSEDHQPSTEDYGNPREEQEDEHQDEHNDNPSQDQENLPPSNHEPPSDEEHIEQAPPTDGVDDEPIDIDQQAALNDQDDDDDDDNANEDAPPPPQDNPPSSISDADLYQLQKKFYRRHFDALSKTPSDDILWWFKGDPHKWRGYLEAFPHYQIQYEDDKMGTGKRTAVQIHAFKPVQTIPNPFDVPYQGDPTSARILHFEQKTGLCRAAKFFKEYRQQNQNRPDYKPWHHIAVIGLHRDFGAASEYIEKVTSNSNYRRKEWARQNCTEEFVLEYINHPETHAIVTCQFHIWDHPKVHSIPLGIKSLPGTEATMQKLIDRVQHHANLAVHTDSDPDAVLANRTQLVMVNFKEWKYFLSRKKWIKHLNSSKFSWPNGTHLDVYNTYRQYPTEEEFEEYKDELLRSKFVLSPSGWGIDCYRNYEALILGTIPVMETYGRQDGWYRVFDDLPVAWIDSHTNLTPQWLQNKYVEIMQKWDTYNWEKMTKHWWLEWTEKLAKEAGDKMGIENKHDGDTLSALPHKKKEQSESNPDSAGSPAVDVSEQLAADETKIDADSPDGLAALQQKFYKAHYDSMIDLPQDDYLYWFKRGVDWFGKYLNAFPHYQFRYTDAKWGVGWIGAVLRVDDKDTGTILNNPFEIPIQGDPEAASVIHIHHKPGLCTAAKIFKEYRELHQDRDDYKPWPHVLIVGLHRDFGAASEGMIGVTSQSNFRRKEWGERNCTEQMVLDYINHPETLAVFTTQFHIFDNPKVHSIPIGMKEINPTQQAYKKLRERVEAAPTPKAAVEVMANRTQLVMVNFKIWKYFPGRKVLMNHLESKKFSWPNGTHYWTNNTYNQHPNRMQFHAYLEELLRSKFVLSPNGWGIDCYRNYESLVVGTIPVIETMYRKDGWFRIFDELPVAWIDTYDDLTPQWLEEKYADLMEKWETYNWEKLTRHWWIDETHRFVQQAQEMRKKLTNNGGSDKGTPPALPTTLT